jgi:glycosyltransferase involved in cell wall biosynthesis
MIPVSVVLPVKNGINFLAQSREDITRNINQDDEIIVINDGSTDGSENFLSDWSREDNRMRYINGQGKGLVSALNLGVKEASNDWIARFDVDDKYSPNRLSTQRKDIGSGTVAIFSDYEIWSKIAGSLGVIPSAVFPVATSISLISSQRTAHPSVIINKSALLEIGMYREIDFPAEDLSLWLRLSRVGKLRTIPQVLLRYQLTPNSITNNRRTDALKKSKLLVDEIGINPLDIDSIFLEIDDLFAEYKNMELGLHRKILLLRELNIIRKMKLLKPAQSRVLKFETMKLSKNIDTYGVAFKVLVEQRRRKNLRQN